MRQKLSFLMMFRFQLLHLTFLVLLNNKPT